MSGESLVLRHGMSVRKAFGSVTDKKIYLGWDDEEDRLTVLRRAENTILNSLWDHTDLNLDGAEYNYYEKHLKRVLNDASQDYHKSTGAVHSIPLGLILRGTFFESGEDESSPIILPSERWRLITCVFPLGSKALKQAKYTPSPAASCTRRMIFLSGTSLHTVEQVNLVADILRYMGYSAPWFNAEDFPGTHGEFNPYHVEKISFGNRTLSNGWKYTATYHKGPLSGSISSGSFIAIDLDMKDGIRAFAS